MEIISNKKLVDLGLIKLGETVSETEFLYDTYQIIKNDSVLEVTTEYSLKGVPEHQYADFNGQVLKGKEIRPFELKFLIELM
jgi:hypothetical protein